MGGLSRTKGAAFEREIARCLREHGIDAERNLTECGRGNGGDVLCPGLTIQVKVGQAPSPWRALAEAVEAAEGTRRMPVAVLRRNRAPGRERVDAAILRLDDFLDLLEQAHRHSVGELLGVLAASARESETQEDRNATR